MANKYVHKIASRYLQKWLRYDIKHVKTGTFHVISGLNRDFRNFIFVTDFDASSVLTRVIFRVLYENLTYKHVSQL